MAGARHVVLLGLMGSGKTSIGRRVATQLDRELLDCDELLEQRTGGRTAADVASASGLPALHLLEEEVALDALDAEPPAVVGLAASTIESSAVRERLRGHLVVWLVASPEYLADRAKRKSHRPLIDSSDLESVLARQQVVRDPLAREVATLVIDVEATDKDRAAGEIVAAARRV